VLFITIIEMRRFDEQPFTSSPLHLFSPDWSRQGDWIVCEGYDANGRTQIYKLDLDGSILAHCCPK
jgi:Tol biopolymer transport system component